jgi:membrane fusion protein (multidrug efflux system)
MVARIIAMDSIASAQSRNVRFRARLENPFAIAPNAAVNVAIPVGEPAMRTRAPITAVRRDGLGDYVFVLEPEQAAAGEGGAVEGSYRARRQSVTIGQEEGQTVAIMAGLEPGQLIAANGAFKLRNQLLVHIKQRDQRGREAGPPQS